MIKRVCKFLSLILIVILVLTTTSYSANIKLNAYVYSDYTILNYIITFDKNETFSTFNLEIPKDAVVSYVVDKNGPIQYNITNDWLKLRSNNKDNKVVLLKIKSKELSTEINKTDTFKIIENFKREIKNFVLKISLEDNVGQIIDLFPENCTLENNNLVKWEEKNFGSNGLFIVNFKKKQEKPKESNYSNNNFGKNQTKRREETFYQKNNFYILVAFFILIVVILLFLFFVIYPKYLKNYLSKTLFNSKNKKDTSKDIDDDNEIENEIINENNSQNKNFKSKSPKTIKPEEINLNLDKNIEININSGPKIDKNNKDDENKNKNKSQKPNQDEELLKIIEKHLTDNEKSIVKVVQKNEGILQQNILDFIPSMTSSNLSKIIKKLNAKRILNRIRVGKVNKIYLGEKLKPTNDTQKEIKE